jgi:glutamine amidotransferase
MDENPRWRLLAPGELVHVGADQPLTARVALDAPPVRRLTLADLHPGAAASQTAAATDG